MGKATALVVGALLLVGAACSSSDGGDAAPADAAAPTKNYSVAYKLAVVGGDSSDEAAFQDAIDCIMASGIRGAETEKKVGDTLVASWQAGGKSGTLLEWAQALC